MLSIADLGALVIDVREPQECQQSPVNGSINIPRGIIETALHQHVQDSHHPIYLHCATAMRATLAAEQLIKLSYSRISVIQAPPEAICKARSNSE